MSGSMSAPALTLRDLFLRNRARHAARFALACDDRTWTHGALGARATRLADALAAAGVRHGDRVGMLATNCGETIELLAACALAGAIFVPLNFRLAAAELRAILEDCTPRIVFVQGAHGAAMDEAVRGLDGAPRVVPLEGADGYEAFVARGEDRVPDVPVAESDVASIIYTSGSTGKAKGVMLGQRGQVEAARQLALTASVRPDSTLGVAMPLFHVGAINQTLAYLFVGGGAVIHRRFDAAALAADVARRRLTGLHLAPVMVKSLLDSPDAARFDLGSLEVIKYASSPMPLPTLERAIERFGPILVQYYGLTETGGLVSALQKHEHVLGADGAPPAWLRSGGKPHPVCEVAIRDDDGRTCPVGADGEIFVGTPSAMLGYWNNAAATQATLVDGWIATGDVGHLDADGYLYIVDRRKDMIVSGGENIYSREVEEALLSHGTLAEVAVIGVPDARWGEAVKAFVVAKPGVTPPDAATLVEHCRTRIAGYKKPQSIEFTDALPRVSGTGKVDKRALRERYWAGHARGVA
jgi:acyl-CoA synthetase (AMP-forming)/AMP-acid ligase II